MRIFVLCQKNKVLSDEEKKALLWSKFSFVRDSPGFYFSHDLSLKASSDLLSLNESFRAKILLFSGKS